MNIYIESTKHLDKRFMIFRTENKENVVDKIIELENNEIGCEMIDLINKFISNLNEKNIKLYIIGCLVNEKGKLKNELNKTNEAKNFYKLVESKNIEVHNFKNMTLLRDELVKVIINYSKSKKNPVKVINNIEYRVFSDYNGEYKTINLYLRSMADYSDENRIGYSVAVLNKNSISKELYFTNFNTTSNRMLLIACIEAIKMLKEPCAINIYTHTHLGFSGGKINRELKEELFRLLKEGNHCVKEYISNTNQKYLNKLIKTKFKL